MQGKLRKLRLDPCCGSTGWEEAPRTTEARGCSCSPCQLGFVLQAMGSHCRILQVWILQVFEKAGFSPLGFGC